MRLLGIIVLCGGCLSNGIDRDIEPGVSIQQGIYGQLTMTSDVAGQDSTVYKDGHAEAFDPTTLASQAAVDADPNGIYQLDLPPGRYLVCVNRAPATHGAGNPGPCTTVEWNNGRVRRDWQGNLSGGWWCETGRCSD